MIPSLYHEFKKYGSDPIDKLAYCNTSVNSSNIDDRKNFFESAFNDDDQDIINKVVDEYGHLTGNQLINLTHEKNSPWHKYFKKNDWFTEIPTSVIQNHYARLANNV